MEIPASGRAGSSDGTSAWHTKVARQLHHRFGFAMRKAKQATGEMDCWRQAGSVAAGFVRWTHVLDEQLAENPLYQTRATDTKLRVLQPHISDASTRTDDAAYDEVSIASTASWVCNGSSRRAPRHRPNRRARKNQRLRAQDEIWRCVALDSVREAEWESQGLPLSVLSHMVTCFEVDEECGSIGSLESLEQIVKVHPFAAGAADEVADSVDGDEDDLQPSHRKRKHGESFADDEADVSEVSASQSFVFRDLAEGTEDNSDSDAPFFKYASGPTAEFYRPMESALFNFRKVLSEELPSATDSIVRLARKLQTAGERLRRAITTSESLLLNGVSLSSAIAFIQDINENLMDRVTHTSIPGPLEWSAALFC